MKKILFLLFITLLTYPAFANNANVNNDADVKNVNAKNFFDFTVEAIDGKEFSLSQLKGKKIMVVNVASKCGLTPQYTQLQELYDKYKDNNFTVIAFPANNFGKQEPGTNEEIKNFCTSNYNVTFPLMAKISVKGEDIAPIYKWLTDKNENGKESIEVLWNFQKFLIDEEGNWVKSIDPRVIPTADEIISWITAK
jgi:glutathione peroxidase